MKNQVRELEKTIDFEKNDYKIILHTNMGDIKIELYPDDAPKHCRNMIALTQAGFYDGLIFHRIIKDFVCQAGCPEGKGTGGPGYKVDAEFNEREHVAGTLSMARSQDPNSAGSQFFLCLGRLPYLDRQYTVFGKTADDASLGVVKKIGAVETDGGDRPHEDVVIQKAEVEISPR